MGARYKLYCSNVARTYFVDPKKVCSLRQLPPTLVAPLQ
jgi:nucleosome binding factor SPN SPT16 subunit